MECEAVVVNQSFAGKQSFLRRRRGLLGALSIICGRACRMLGPYLPILGEQREQVMRTHLEVLEGSCS